MQTAVGDFLVNYEVLGEKNAPPLIILHGWGRNFQDWIATAKVLASKYRIVLVDLPGFGGTNLPSGVVLGTYDYADFIQSFLEKIEVRKPILLGHSYGGRIGIVLGSKKGVLQKLVLVDSAGLEKRTFTTKLKVFLFKALKFIAPPFLHDNLRSKMGSKDYVQAGPMRAILIKSINENLRSLLPKIGVETLIIWGEKDESQDIKYAKILKDEIKNSKLRVVWEVGHSPHAENQKDFFRILKEELL